MEFLRLPLIALVGTLVYAEAAAAAVFVGAGLIVAGNLVNLRRKQETARLMNSLLCRCVVRQAARGLYRAAQPHCRQDRTRALLQVKPK